MKQIKTIYTLLLAVVLTLLTACTFGDETTENGTEQKDGKVTVRFRVSQAAPATTRAFEDNNATEEEMMNVWTVVITDNNGSVKHILACEPTDDYREIDPIETKLELAKGIYNFYSFANISPENVKYLLGIRTDKPTTSDDTFNGIAKGTIKEITSSGTITKEQAEAKTIGINAKDFDIKSDDNGYGSTGIPMSNIQTMTIDENTNIVDLIVVRMLAKIKLEIKNDGAENVTITSITLTDITKYDATKDNLKLFPKYTDPENANTMEAVHGDIQPNLADNATTGELEITPSSPGVTVSSSDNPSTPSAPSTPWTIETGKSLNITFYVNESENPKGENWGKDDDGTTQQFNRYFLKIKMKNGEKDEEVRYTLIDDSNADKGSDKWDYIARNDYRIIPIVLDDYKLDMIPYDFPAIGVYPASVKEEDGIYTITFHDYGHFHLLPVVTRYSDSSVVSYGSSENAAYWTFEDGNKILSQSDLWGSWTDASKKYAYYNEAPDFAEQHDGYLKTLYHDVPFYRQGHTTEIKDGDDAGGEPVWYRNAASSSPQWDPAGGTNYQPFIFGYIADPGEIIKNGDKKVYHEFTINLYKSGSSAPRQMTYRLYMILDQDQMLYRSRSLAAPVPRHTHGH